MTRIVIPYGPFHGRTAIGIVVTIPCCGNTFLRQQCDGSRIYGCGMILDQVPVFVVKLYYCCGVQQAGIRVSVPRQRRQAHPRHQPQHHRKAEQDAYELFPFFSHF